MDKEIASNALSQMIKEVGHCGFYHEIYQSRLIEAVRDYFFKLSEEEQAIFILVATEDYEIHFDDDSFANAIEEENKCWKEIYGI